MMNNNNRNMPNLNAFGWHIPTDPLQTNRTPFLGAMLNPFAEAMHAKSPAPFFDPIGYGAGWYKPGSTMGNVMNKVNDPLGVFKGGFGGLLG